MLLRKVIEVIFITTIFSSSYASNDNNDYVNILSWWGYIDTSSPEIKKINETCNVKVSSDNYYSNNEFTNIISTDISNYDIVIFSETILDSVKDKVTNKNGELYLLSENYDPIFKKHYKDNNLPKNIAFFSIALSGFLYNPDLISIYDGESIEDIFLKGKDNLIFIIDDAVEANYLTKKLEKNTNVENKENFIGTSSQQQSWKNFQKILNGKNVFITNRADSIIKKNNFAFGYMWSGDAIQEIEYINDKLKFYVHPDLSYLSLDLIADISASQKSKCVSKMLGSEEYLNSLQEKTFYFTPYSNKNSKSNSILERIYNNSYKKISTLPWIEPVTSDELKAINEDWDYIKFKADKSFEK